VDRVTSFPARSRPPLVPAFDRPRLSAKLAQSWNVPLTVVAAPAGSGKSWLLAGFAQADKGPGRRVLWYQADRATLDHAGFVQQIFEVLEGAGLMTGATPVSVEAFVSTAFGARSAEALLVVDDAHVLAGSGAESALGELVYHLPPWLHLALLSRQPPGVDVSRLRVADQLLEIGPDELRFRSWEVSDLFRRHHGHDLPPEEIAELARRTGGWAAGLHLFHLAIKGKPVAYRRQMIVSLPTRLRTCRDYLTENVLAGLEPDLREFLIEASVLGVLSGTTCDALLERRGSRAVLEELSGRHLFLTTTDAVAYRMHEVLRGHLEQLLFERLGDEAAAAHCLRAAGILEAEGQLGEAWRAYCRALDWESARRLLHNSAGELLGTAPTWWEPLTGAMAGSDAWVLLARARRQVLAGRWREALETFRRAEALADVPRLATTCTEELMALEGWVEPTSTVPIGWSGTLRQVLTRGPGAVATTRLDEPVDRLVASLAALLAGCPSRAWELLSEGLDSPNPSLEAWGTLSAALAGCLLGRSGSHELAATAAADLEPTLPPWIVRLLELLSGAGAPLVVAVTTDASEELADTANPWAEILVALLRATAGLLCGDGSAGGQAARALELAQGLGSRTLQVWSSLLVAVLSVRDGLPEAERQLRAAERMGRAIGCPGAAFLAERLREGGDPPGVPVVAPPGLSAADVSLWLSVAERLGSHAGRRDGHSAGRATPEGPGTTGRRAAMNGEAEDGRSPDVRLRCFGDFELSISGVGVDLSRAQPKVRAVLHVLAVNAGRVVHRDRLAATLWSNNGEAATRNLQVAVSSLRKFLDGAAPQDDSREARTPGPGAMIGRRGDGYVLELTNEQADVLQFAETLRGAQAARARGDLAAAALAWQVALEIYRGDLLAAEGTADWLVEERELFRTRAAEAAEELAAHRLETGDAAGALRAAGRGLEIDRYRDGLWRALVAAHEQAGELAAAARATADYGRVLEDLGVRPAATAPATASL